MHAAIYFQADGYVLEGRDIMGRRVAGASFLRAAVEGHGQEGRTLAGYAPTQAGGEIFRRAVQAIDPAAKTEWIPMHRLDLVERRRMVYWPDNVVGTLAQLRLRQGPASFGITGITHTISTDKAMAGIVGILSAPVMPWDALICTSTQARAVVGKMFEAEMDYQRWAGRAQFRAGRPQLPVIPLGVHTKDFAASPARRAAARARLGLEEDEIAYLFAGRLSFSAKAHPYPMLVALQAVAAQSGKRIALIMAGKFSHPEAGPYYRAAVQDHSPDVRALFVDGADFDAYLESFAAADIFVSLADSTQESFGLTPIEAMAAGLPVVVTDWNGYKDTVRDGIDGFRINTWMPAAGTGSPLATAYETTANSTDKYQSRTSSTVSVDMAQLIAALSKLATDVPRRLRMGEAGQARARTDYDWAVIYRRYRELWVELDKIRLRALADPGTKAWLDSAPRANSVRLDPYHLFSGYPSAHLDRTTLIRLAPGADFATFEALSASHGFSIWKSPPDVIATILTALAEGPQSIERLIAIGGRTPDYIVELVARLAKMNIVIPEAAPAP